MAVWQAASAYMIEQGLQDVERCSARLLRCLPYQDTLQDNCVLVAYGGGKDSSYMVAFVRLMQLYIFNNHETTFRLRVATNRHIGMPKAVMENIHHIYTALGLYSDPDAELLLVDGNEIRDFDRDLALPVHVVARNRLDILMTGHRCEGEARPTFCNACNLSMVNSFSVAATYKTGVDVIITGDSIKERRAYLAWVRRLSNNFGLPKDKMADGFKGFLQDIDDISQHYFAYIYGERAEEEIEARRIKSDHIRRNPIFFSIYEDTTYEAEAHWQFLSEFLAFEFDDLAFSFTESDCSNPALMAHLRGLKAHHVYDRTYEEGIREYIQFAIELMHKKGFPEHLIEIIISRYETSDAIDSIRDKINRYTQDVFGLSEQQLVCMLYSPFAQRGKNLAVYLQRERPHLSEEIEYIHLLFSSTGNSGHYKNFQILEDQLVAVSGLSIDRLRALYSMDLSLVDIRSPAQANPISMVLFGDPHKSVIKTKHSPDGPPINELISGR
jgi:hypothetical protein